MKKVNFARITWILSIFLILIIILIAIIQYKIYFQYKNNNRIYFYECNGALCLSEVENDTNLLYSKYECGSEECPILKSTFNETYVILEEPNNSILFNYREGKVVSSDYDNYQLLNNNYLIVTKNEYQGLINLDNQILIPVKYDQLGYIKDEYLIGYNLTSIIVKQNNKYGIISIKNGEIIEEIKYEEKEIDSLIKILNEENTSKDSN